MGKRVLVVGDVMFDRYHFVETERQAAEADIPVWDASWHGNLDSWRLGGAANVANNLKRLGEQDIEVFLAGLCEFDPSTMGRITQQGIQVAFMTDSYQTMFKDRFVANSLKDDDKAPHGGEIIFRYDNVKRFDFNVVESHEKNFVDTLRTMQKYDPFDMVVISDYDKGSVTPLMLKAILHAEIPVVVDSKRFDLSMYRGCDVLKLNEKEYDRQIGHPSYVNVERLFKYVVVTKGANGAELRMNDSVKTSGNRYVTHIENFPAEKADTVDVTGCGDTHTAATAFSLMNDPDVRKAIKFANKCAAAVVRKFGTSTI